MPRSGPRRILVAMTIPAQPTTGDRTTPARATVVASQPDGSVLVVLDDGTRITLPSRAVAALRALHPGQRLVLADDGTAHIGPSTLVAG